MTILFDTRNLFVRALKKLVRNPILIFFSLFQPIIFLVLFTQLFHSLNLLPGFPKGVSYLEYASAGILMQNAFSSALQSGTSIVEDLNSGFLQKRLVTQVSRSAILLGRLATDAFRVTVQSIIILALAYALGFRLASGLPGVLLVLFIIAFFGLAWSGTALVPLGFMPSWMQDVSRVNPISYAVNAVRDLSIPGFFSLGAEVAALAFIAGIAVVTIGITLY